jgi:glucans biosynthesis protein
MPLSTITCLPLGHATTRELRLCIVRVLTFMCGLGSIAVAFAEPQYAKDGIFTDETVIEEARRLALAPFAAPRTPMPKSLAGLDYDHYRDIRFRPEQAIWKTDGLSFHLHVLHRGWLFADPVEIALADGDKALHLPYQPDFFSTGNVMTTPLPTEDLGYSGWRALYPINRTRVFDEVVVFQGASYFRSLARDQVYGLSARGLAIKTADPTGEEFPTFRAFWIERPSRGAHVLVAHALLDSPSTSGAYRFTVRPGDSTMIDVEAVLFPRTKLDNVGLAPATSMFMFSANGRERADDFRPEVHDSDTLLIFNGSGEHLLRPLANPVELQVSAFQDHSPKGFGLLQRDRSVADYQDFEAKYERRPSLWIEPMGDWGDGAVVLTEIPSDAEIHDNIVLFWRPRQPLAAGSEYRFSYRLFWGDGPAAAYDRARVLATRRGRADAHAPTPVRRFIIDYSRRPGTHGPKALPEAKVTASAGEVRNVVVEPNPVVGGYRLSFVFDPKQTKLSELRAELSFKDGRLAETWVYRWTAP